MTALTVEQRSLLGELTRAMKAPTPKGGGLTALLDMAAGWLGISSADAQQMLAKVIGSKEQLTRGVLDWAERNPLEAVFEFLTGAALAFYLAEKEVNPKIETYMDAFYYIATCASVGYADIFAVTQSGRAIAALVMIVGPALAARALERPKI